MDQKIFAEKFILKSYPIKKVSLRMMSTLQSFTAQMREFVYLECVFPLYVYNLNSNKNKLPIFKVSIHPNKRHLSVFPQNLIR